MTNTEELSALQVISQEHTEVDTENKAEQLLPVLGDREREEAVKQPSQSLCLYLYLPINDFLSISIYQMQLSYTNKVVGVPVCACM